VRGAQLEVTLSPQLNIIPAIRLGRELISWCIDEMRAGDRGVNNFFLISQPHRHRRSSDSAINTSISAKIAGGGRLDDFIFAVSISYTHLGANVSYHTTSPAAARSRDYSRASTYFY
jgi:hypothetical protein